MIPLNHYLFIHLFYLTKKGILQKESPASSLSVVTTSLLSSKLSDLSLLPQMESLCSKARPPLLDINIWVKIRAYFRVEIWISQHHASAKLPDRDKCWGGGGRAVKEEDMHNLPLLISVGRKQDLPRTLWCSFPSSLHHPCTPRHHRTRGIEW